MEIEDGLKKYTKKDYEKSLKYVYATACKDSNFKALVNSLKLKEKDAIKYTSKLQRTIEEINNCENCKGLGFCKNPTCGYVYYPTTREEHLDFSYISCKYTKKLSKEKKNITFYELPSELQNASMSKIDVTDKSRSKVIKWLKEFYDNYLEGKKVKGLYLHGSFGSGKSYLITALLNELSKKRINIIAVYYPFLLRKLKDSFKTNFDSKLNDLIKADILLLDDIGAESVSEWSRDEILGTILQYRMDNALPTFFTSNLSISDLEQHLSNTKNNVDKVKSRRIIERINQLTETMEMVSENRRK